MGIDLDPTVGGGGFSQEGAVLFQGVAVANAEPVEEACGASMSVKRNVTVPEGTVMHIPSQKWSSESQGGRRVASRRSGIPPAWILPSWRLNAHVSADTSGFRVEPHSLILAERLL